MSADSNRRMFLKEGALVLGGVSLSGCEALNNLDTSAGSEGTGIQFTGLIKVLATYRGTPTQQKTAARTAGKVYVEKALRPAYTKRKKAVQAASVTDVKRVKKVYAAKVKAAKRASDPVAEAAVVKQEAAEVAAVEKKAAVQEAAVDKSWQQLAIASSGGAYNASDIRVPTSTATASLASVRSESNMMLASASQYVAPTLAVSVPKAQLVSAEKTAADSVMFWDSGTRKLSSPTVYVIDKKPSKGKVAKIGDTSAEYYGAGM